MPYEELRRKYQLVKRTLKKPKPHKVYYYRLVGDPARALRSTGRQTSETAAWAWLEEMEARANDSTLGEYLAPFWTGACPHLRRIRDEGRNVTVRYIADQRKWIEKYILTDPLCKKKMSEINRGDILAFRSRMNDNHKGHLNTVNKIMAALKTVFREALIHEVIQRDPFLGIGSIKENRKAKGIFTREEMMKLFATCPGPWPSAEAYLAFALAASTGMRRGEILALRWKSVDTKDRMIVVEEAWKGGDEIGKPKSGKPRLAPLTRRMSEALEDWRAGAPADEFVFGGEVMRRETWWQKNFTRAMKNAGINTTARNITAHSLRHTLNTMLRDAGKDPAKIRWSLGWADEKIQDHYTHFAREHLKELSDETERMGL